MVGDTYTIVDMALWGWARNLTSVFGTGAWDSRPHLKRFMDEINARPAAQRADAIKDRFKFKTEADAETIRSLFPTLAAVTARA
jgi:GST-like protein